jgi:hypothetical protein
VAVAAPDCWYVVIADALAASILAMTVSPPLSAIAATEALINVTINKTFRVFMG